MAQPTYTGFVAVTPSDTAKISKTAGLWIGGAGSVAVLGVNSASVTFTNVAAGTLLPIAVTQVLATGTTATNIVALR